MLYGAVSQELLDLQKWFAYQNFQSFMRKSLEMLSKVKLKYNSNLWYFGEIIIPNPSQNRLNHAFSA